MRFFVCLLGAHRSDIEDALRRRYEAFAQAHDATYRWHVHHHASLLTASNDAYDDALVVTEDDHWAAGTVRLDNRREVERWCGSEGQGLSDLALVLRAVTQHGTRYIRSLLGDFAFVVWNGITRTALAAVDPFAIRKLYYTLRPGRSAFASRAEFLALDGEYEPQYLAEQVATCVPTRDLTVYAGVKSLPAATWGLLNNGQLTTTQYWSPYEFAIEQRLASNEQEASAICRQLVCDSVALRLDRNGDTWAQLSGGMDSSSVVSVAEWLRVESRVAHGLNGTITYVDSHGTGGDEREYSNAVVKRWGLRNETIVDAPLWRDDTLRPPLTDQPTAYLIVYPREGRVCELLRGAGGRVLLTGVGGDELFAGNMFFFADWIVQGRVVSAVREMARRAMIGRVSFWELAYLNVLLPLLPRRLQARLVRDPGIVPSWMARAAIRKYGLATRTGAAAGYAGRIGHKYYDAVASGLAAVAVGLQTAVMEDAFDVRHPFLYRPLVEFALRLPAELRVRPHARKWILREAMRGILPEVVRTRVGKGVIVGGIAWSTATKHNVLEPLVQEPILADLGIIDAARLRAGLRSAQQERANRQRLSSAVQNTLAIEAWLQMRSGRWPRWDRTQPV